MTFLNNKYLQSATSLRYNHPTVNPNEYKNEFPQNIVLCKIISLWILKS